MQILVGLVSNDVYLILDSEDHGIIVELFISFAVCILGCTLFDVCYSMANARRPDQQQLLSSRVDGNPLPYIDATIKYGNEKTAEEMEKNCDRCRGTGRRNCSFCNRWGSQLHFGRSSTCSACGGGGKHNVNSEVVDT